MAQLTKTVEFTQANAPVAPRLDEVLSQVLSLSRSTAKKVIENGVTVNGKPTDKPALKLKPGVHYTVEYAPLEEAPSTIVPNPDISVGVIYEDDALMVIDKPRGLVVHTAPGHMTDTLVNYLVSLKDEFAFDEQTMEGGRPGIVHRLDKDTSGLLLVAKTPMAQKALQAQIKDHKVNRKYIAICYGDVNEDAFTVNVPLLRPNHTQHKAMPSEAGLPAITHFKKIWAKNGVSLVRCELETGRTHQIRAHLAYIGHPIVGDPLYCPKVDHRFEKGQLLHAYEIAFVHPLTHKPMTFYAPMDAYFQKGIETFDPEE